MATTVHRTCTLCEATCGLSLRVEGERILAVRPDPDDPISRGYVCPKGIAIAEVHDDPDRLRQPMRRTARGQFAPIGWDEALDEAAAGIERVQRRHGRDAVAIYWGNPLVHNHGALLVRTGLNKTLGTRNVYGAGSQDTSPRFAASYHLYGSSIAVPVPDVDRTDYLLCIGANPLVSNGSAMTAPDMRSRLRALRKRGGKLVVVDPRRSETAHEADEHVAIRPGTDAALLLALCAVLVRSGRADTTALRRDATGWDAIEARLRALDLDACARTTGVAAERIARLAVEFAERPTSVAYSRIGVCNTRFGTLASYATDLLNAVAGRLGAVGGAAFSSPAIDITRVTRQKGMDGHARWRTRVRGLPETFGEMPSAALAEEIETPGEGQIRALVSFAGNPVLSIPNGKRLAAALETLDFQVAVDLYVNETTRHADLILPPAWTLAEEHVDLLFPLFSVRNAVRWSPPVVAKRDDERHDWEILLALAQRLGGGPTGMKPVDTLLRGAERLGWRWTPESMIDLLLRTGPHGDRFLPWSRGLSLRKLKRAAHGLDLGPLEPGVARRVFHADRKVHLAPAPILASWDELDASLAERAPEGVLLLIGRRTLRSNNSWMHNVPSLVSGAARCVLLLHPKDAADRGIADGDTIVMESRVHRGAVRVALTEDIAPGVVSLPHGWGHAASAPWQHVAGAHAGVSANDWTDEAVVEGVVGQSVLNGVPVRVYRQAAGGAGVSPSPDAFYASAAVERFEVDDATLALRRFGSGPALVLIHGFPVHGATWRFLLPALAERHSCLVLDLPGLGDSGWSARTDFSFTGQARRVAGLLKRLGVERCALLAHDTGATVARLATLAEPARVAKLAILNTEIPGHRPPWIPLYQKLTRVPGSAAVFHVLLQQPWFVRSGMGFREFYSDRRRFDDPTRLAPYLDPVLASSQRMRGMLLYLRGPEWDAVDALRTRHAQIRCPVLLLWGEDDRTFPVDRAEPMRAQFGGPTSFARIPHASLMPHEERPDVVLASLLPFLAEP